MGPSPVTIGYEYECPRFAYELDCEGGTETVEAGFCVRRDNGLACVEATDIVTDRAGTHLRFETAFERDAAAVEGFEADQVGTTVLEVQFIRRPSVVDRLAAWRWPPRIDDPPFDPTPDADAVLYPDPDRVACSGEVIHSLEAAPAGGRSD